MKSIILLCLSIIALNVFGQTGWDEVVYLKDGSMVRGIIIERVPNEKIKIQTIDGNVFEYKYADIEKITKEPSRVQPPTIQTPTYTPPVMSPQPTSTSISSPAKKEKKDYYRKGFVGITEFGTVFGRHFADDFDEVRIPNAKFAFNQVIGSRTSPHFGIGMCVGVEVTGNKYFETFEFRQIVIPTGLDMRIYFINKRISPFLNLAPCYAPIFLKDSEDREIIHSFVMNMGVGAEFKITQKFGILINIGGRLVVIPNNDFLDDNLVGGAGYAKFGIVY